MASSARASTLVLLMTLAACSSTVTSDDDDGQGQGAGEQGADTTAVGPTTGVGPSSGQGGAGGMHGDPCFLAAPKGHATSSGECEAWQEGTNCQWHWTSTGLDEGGVVLCEAGEWKPVDCPIVSNSTFDCYQEGVLLNACDEVWTGLECPWFVADAGFSCGGRAVCEDDHWVSLGVDFSEKLD